jgi:uracil phosphoribosyltransferase
MNTHILGKEHSLLSQFISELRDATIQKDSMRFRKNMERIGEIFAYEISKRLEWAPTDVTTPLGIAHSHTLAQQPVITSILRAGLPLHQGLMNFFDKAESGFVAAFRKHHKDNTFDISLEYLSCPKLADKVLIITDPMLATGSSMLLTYKSILELAKPSHTHIVVVVASSQGIQYLKSHLGTGITLWVGEVDEELTAQSYIVPGLGDAGDLAFGAKK